MSSILLLTLFVTSVEALKCFAGEAYLDSLTDSVVHVHEFKTIDRCEICECRSCLMQHFVPSSDEGRKLYTKAIKMGCNPKSCKDQDQPGSGYCEQIPSGVISSIFTKVTYLEKEAAVYQCCTQEELDNYGTYSDYELLGQSKAHLKSLLPDFNTTTSSGEFRTYLGNGEYHKYTKGDE